MMILQALSLPWLIMPRQTSLQKKPRPPVRRWRAPALPARSRACGRGALQLPRFALGEAAQEAVGHSERDLAHARIRPPPLLRQLQMRQPPVVGAAVAADQTLALEAIEHARHGARVIRDALAQIRRRHGSLRPRQIRNDDELRG